MTIEERAKEYSLKDFDGYYTEEQARKAGEEKLKILEGNK